MNRKQRRAAKARGEKLWEFDIDFGPRCAIEGCNERFEREKPDDWGIVVLDNIMVAPTHPPYTFHQQRQFRPLLLWQGRRNPHVARRDADKDVRRPSATLQPGPRPWSPPAAAIRAEAVQRRPPPAYLVSRLRADEHIPPQ